ADPRELRTLSRAGYAIPLLFPPIRFRGDWFVDGGFAWNIPLDHCLALDPSEIYLLAPIASQLPYVGRFRTFAGFVQRLLDVMWRTIGNMGYLYAAMEDQRFHGVPVTVIEPTEQWSGFGPLAVFHAHPRKNQNLIAAGYRDAKRALAARRRRESRMRPVRPVERVSPEAAAAPPGGGAGSVGGGGRAHVPLDVGGHDGRDDAAVGPADGAALPRAARRPCAGERASARRLLHRVARVRGGRVRPRARRPHGRDALRGGEPCGRAGHGRRA